MFSTQTGYVGISGANQPVESSAPPVYLVPGRACTSETITAVLATTSSNWTVQLIQNSNSPGLSYSVGSTASTTCTGSASLSIAATDLLAFEISVPGSSDQATPPSI